LLILLIRLCRGIFLHACIKSIRAWFKRVIRVSHVRPPFTKGKACQKGLGIRGVSRLGRTVFLSNSTPQTVYHGEYLSPTDEKARALVHVLMEQDSGLKRSEERRVGKESRGRRRQ